MIFGIDWGTQPAGPYEPTTEMIGHAFLGRYLLPFEVAGLMLLAALLAAVVVARKEIKDEEPTGSTDEDASSSGDPP